jgi:alpha-galactosidase
VEAEALRRWIALHKRLRPLLHGGTAWRLPEASGRTAHGVVASDRRSAAFAVVQERAPTTRLPPPLRLPGLEPGVAYRLAAVGAWPTPASRALAPAHELLRQGELVLPGERLATIGITLPELRPETALLLELQSVQIKGS